MKRSLEQNVQKIANSKEIAVKIENLDECDIVESASKYGFEDENSIEYDQEPTMTAKPHSLDRNGKSTSDKRWRSRKVACHICGKLYEACKLQFHLNQHNGTSEVYHSNVARR